MPALSPSKFVVDPNMVRGRLVDFQRRRFADDCIFDPAFDRVAAAQIFLIAFFLLSIFSFYSVSALLDGTPVILLCLLYFGILYALQNEQDELAGALLVLTFFRWEVGLFFSYLWFGVSIMKKDFASLMDLECWPLFF